MGMTITITVEEDLPGGQHLAADRTLLDLEIDYASFDVVCYTIGKLREEIEHAKQEMLRQNNA